jgi:hypothetical protein
MGEAGPWWVSEAKSGNAVRSGGYLPRPAMHQPFNVTRMKAHYYQSHQEGGGNVGQRRSTQ